MFRAKLATQDIHDLPDNTTAEELSSQEAEAELQPATDPQAQIDMLLRQATADMQRRVRNVSSLVMGRLVRAAAVEQANKGREHPNRHYAYRNGQ
ncbi:TPA: hypothetical protein ACH3X1_015526 [Trebouxia sp. C0004]